MTLLPKKKKKGDDEKNVSNTEQNQEGGNEEEEMDPFAHLPVEEAEILERQVKTPKADIGYMTLYRYATKKDIGLLIVGYLSSIIYGAALPLFTIIFGNMTQDFNDFFTDPEVAKQKFQDMVNHNALFFLYLGIGITVFTFISMFMLVNRGEVLASRIREQYLAAILRQNIAYFDKLGAGEVTSRITNDTNTIQEGISEKVGVILSGFATFVSALVVGFIKDWKLTLIMLSVVVALILALSGPSVFVVKYTTQESEAYGPASSIAEETFSAIRTTVAFGTQERLSDKFDKQLKIVLKKGIYKGFSTSVMVAAVNGVVFCAYALSLWQGSRFIASGDSKLGDIITVLIATMIGAFMLANVTPSFQNIGKAVASAQKIFETIDRKSSVDPSSEEGEKLSYIHGDIQLQNIKFVYPARPDVTVLDNMNLEIKSGQTVALVGMSGSGKSTIVGLIERFYDPVAGNVFIDGHDITGLNVKRLRQQISLVSQEPVLFAVSIYENIAFGLIGTDYESASDEKKRELVIEACKEANAWDFIQSMSDGLETNVGDRGFLMSGGQKQRIAIARAIISNPKILLLDEATSALDTKSEGIVQEALDRAAKDRTTIVIAHRLSTIKHANNIVVMSKGQIVEMGTHNELLSSNGSYAKLVEAQKINNSTSFSGNTATGTESSSDTEPEELEKLYKQEDEILLSKKGTNTTTGGESVNFSASKTGAESQEEEIPKRGVVYLVRMLYQFNKGEKWNILIGTFFSLLAGFSYPGLNILFAKVIESVMVPPSKYGKMRHDINAYSGYIFMIGVLTFIFFGVMFANLFIASSNLVRRIRLHIFRHYLRMDIGFFDKDNNTAGSLTSTLAKDAQSIEGLGGATLGQILQSIVLLVTGIIVGLAFNWRLALVCTATVPLLVLSGFAEVYVLLQLEQRAKKVYEKSGSYASEGVSAIRTVASLTREHGVWQNYHDQVSDRVRASVYSTMKSSLFYALSQGLSPWIMGLGFWYGSTLLKNGTTSVFAFFIAFTCVVFSAQSAGNIFSYSPNMGKAKQAGDNISHILSILPKIDTWSQEGKRLDDSAAVEGNIEFRDIDFRYPTRPHVPVLRKLNLKVQKEQYVALVGASGSGKSTTVQLAERFYDPLSGIVTLDGQDISKLNVNSYRKHLALVQQEPVLYSGTIRENILLGTTDDQQITDEDMYEAAKKANIHDFIMSLPDGYDTVSGAKGSLLSGGQKQRVAIARALIRNPKVLLLDEATSALDSESEKVVQQALDEAAKGRTTIAVAHRISSIQNADMIYVFDKGEIVESGTHQQLLSKQGKYYELVQMQSLDN